MSTLVEELSAKARTLSPEDRARLAEDLLASLEQSPESSTATEAAWEHEIQRRVEEVKAGTAKLVTGRLGEREPSSSSTQRRPTRRSTGRPPAAV